MEELVVALLDDEYGITERAYRELCDACDDKPKCLAILNKAKATEGRFYLPTGWDDKKSK